MKVELVKAFGWSLYDIDRTDLESLLPFINTLTGVEVSTPAFKKKTYIDQVSWL